MNRPMLPLGVLPVLRDAVATPADAPLEVTFEGRRVVDWALLTLVSAGLPTVVVAGPGVDTPRLSSLTDGDVVVVRSSGLSIVDVCRAALVHGLSLGPVTHLVVHDPGCPLLPAATLREVLALVETAPEKVHALSRPVTDTIKVVRGGQIHQTVPRESLRDLFSPVIVPAGAISARGEGAGRHTGSELAVLLRAVSRDAEVVHVTAPAIGRVIHDAQSLVVLRALRDVAGAEH
ncbi:MAG: 2-C-methyl-D-erythritol 4-phosphate cytidylyltransferase [Nostocoides sp.]